MWQPSEVISFASDCIRHGVNAVSLGGGEPFEYEGVFEVIDALTSDWTFCGVEGKGIRLSFRFLYFTPLQ